MASQSWRQYGSINQNESSNSGYFNNLVVDNLTLKKQYNGFLNVNGALSVTDGVNFNSTLSVTSDVNLNHNLTVAGITYLNSQLNVADIASFKQTVNIAGDLNIVGAFQFQNDIRSNGNLAASGTSLILGFNKPLGTSSLDSNSLISGLIGLNTPIGQYNTLPGSALDVYNGAFTTNTAMNVFNGVSTTCQSVLVSTLSNQNENTFGQTNYTPSYNEFFTTPRNGIIAYTDTNSCSINFFTSQSQSIKTTINKTSDGSFITVDTIVPTAGDLAITYTSANKTLLISGQQYTVIPSSIVIGAPDDQTIFNETLSLFTNTQSSSATALLPNYYDVSTNRYSTWNTLTMVSPNENNQIPSASTFMNMIDSNNQFGFKIGGGTYINDTTRSVGMLGVTTDSNTNWAPSQMIVSGLNPAYCHTTTGINTFAPHTEKYSLDINGAVKITDGEIVLIKQNQPYNITSIISCSTNRSIIMALGSSDPSYTNIVDHHDYFPTSNLFSIDGGINWNISKPYKSTIHLQARDGHIYDISHAILTYNNSIITSTTGFSDNWYGLNFGDAVYNSNGTLKINQSVTNSISCNCSSIRFLKFTYPGVLIVFSGTELSSFINPTPSPTNQYLYYSYLQKISNISVFAGGVSYLFLTKFRLDISFANTIDGYDTSYLFVAGSTGIYKYSINTSYCDTDGNDGCNLWVPNVKSSVLDDRDNVIRSITPAETISHTASITYNVKKYTYNKMQTYKSYDSFGNLLPDTYFSVFVGNGIITSTLDGGHTFYDVKFSDISFNSVYIHDSLQAIATATNGIIYTTTNGGINWSSALNEFNRSGVATTTLMNPTSNLTSVCMSSSNDFIISRLDVSYNTITKNIPSTNLYFCHLPCLFNRQYSSILDICGSMSTYGYSYVQQDLTVGNNTMIGGSIAVNSGSVQIKQGSYDPYGSTGIGATMVINGGVGITGNVLIGNNLTVNNNAFLSNISSITPNGNLILSTGSGNINIGSYSTLFPNLSANINIGSTNDHITLFGSVTSTGALTTGSDKVSVYINTDIPDIQKNAGVTIGGGIINKTNVLYSGYMMTDTNNTGILLKAPDSNNSVDLLLDSMKLNSTITRGLITLESLQNYKNNYGYSLSDQYDPSYIISSCTNIDISNIILSTNVNSINNVQTITTSIAINGNLSVLNGNIRINQISTSSSDTSTGAIVVSGGIGISGNINSGGYVKILNTDPYNALSVSGGVVLGGNLITNGNLSVGGTTDIYGNVDILNGSSLYVSNGGHIFIDVINSVNGSYPYRTLLSMTDFSNNVTFHSTSDAYSPTSGSLQVVGGAGISGNIFVGGNTVILGKIPSNGTNSGALQVVGGAGISGNVFVGGNTIILGNIPSNGTNSGALQVVGGAGISGNIFVGGSTIILGNTNSNSTNSGALQVVGGVGISQDLLIGGNITIGGLLNVTSAVPSVSCYTGVTMGGLGIQGNLFVNNQSYQGSNAALLSGLVLYYPFSTDISNYATGTAVTDMVFFQPVWPYNILPNQYGHMVGGPGGNALDISSNLSSSTTNPLISIFPPTQIQNLTNFTVSFWISIQNIPPSGSIFSLANLFDFNPSNQSGSNSKPSILYASIGSDGRIFVNSSVGSIPPSLPGYQTYSNTNFTNNKSWNLFTFNCTVIPTNSNYAMIVYFYINGVLENKCYIDSFTSPLPFSTFNNLMIGYNNNTAVTSYHYLLNDFRLYNRVLSVNEIVQIYDSSGLATWITDIRYNETMILNSDTTTYTTTPSYNTAYTPISFPPNITTAISGNLAVSGFSNLRGNTLIMGDLNVTGYVLQNGTRLGYNVTDSSMIVAGTGGYFGGNLFVGKIFLNTLTLGNGGYFGGSTTSGDISLNRIKLGAGGYFGGSTTNGDISLNHINLGSGGYFGGNINSGDISLNHLVIGGSSVSTTTSTGNLQVIGGVGIGGNINIGGATSTLTAGTSSTTTSTGVLVVTGGGGVGIGGAVNIGGATSTYTAGTTSTTPSTGVLVVNGTGGVGIGGNINIGGTTSTLTAGTTSTTPSTGVLVVTGTGGVGIGGAVNIGGATSTYTAGTTSTTPSTGVLVVNGTGGVGIGGNINIGGTTSTLTAGTTSTTPSTGVLVVTGTGGVGIGGAVNIGGATSTLTAGTSSTTSSTGVLVVTGTGGVGIGGNINVGGATSTLTAGTSSTTPSTGVLVVTGTGGVGIGGNINVGGAKSTYTANTSSTSITTGTLVVTGGVGISENVNVGKTITTTNLTIQADSVGNNGILTINSGSTLKINDTTVNAVVVSGRGNFGSLNISGAITGGSCTLSGGVVTATSFNATSDYRIKTSITDLDPTFTIDHLRPVKYTNIHDSKEYIGFIAHEIQQTYPFLVTGEKDGEETQTMNYDGIIGILVNEIKLLKQRICILENK